MRARVEWLDDDEQRLLIDEAVGLLERVGMRTGPCAALDMLADAGADVDRAAGVAKLPADLVARALAGCPREVLLAGATPADDVLLDGSDVHFVPSGTPTHVLDHETGTRRPATLNDQVESTIVADAMDVVDVMWALVTPTEVADRQRLFSDYLTLFTWSQKHIQEEVTEPWQVAPVLRMMDTLCGGREAFRRRPRLSIVCCTSSPLGIDGAFLDVCLDMARAGVPVVVYPMPIAGGTAPLSVPGAVAMNLAEFMGAATVFQLAAPGLPTIMGAGASLLDMHTGSFRFAAPEAALLTAACAVTGHRLGVPVLCPGLASDADHPGLQAGYEKAAKGLVAVTAGADLITGGLGLLQGAGLMSLPQIVLDGEIAGALLRIAGGAPVTGHEIMADEVAEVGFGGHFLGRDETRRRLHSGDVAPPSGMAAGSGAEAEVVWATRRAQEIVAAARARGPKLDAGMLAELQAIVSAAVDGD